MSTSIVPFPTPAPRLFDLSLPGLRLEAGAQLPIHLVRGWWWGPEEDLPWLHSRARVLPEEEARESTLRVISRTTAEQRHAAERARP
ncbi:homoserine acetyltransferase, partial [Pyxidicoccus sp. 3LFB2]